MKPEPDFVIEIDKDARLPRALNFAIIINEFPFPIGIEVNHNKFQDPIITLIPVEEKKGREVI